MTRVFEPRTASDSAAKQPTRAAQTTQYSRNEAHESVKDCLLRVDKSSSVLFRSNAHFERQNINQSVNTNDTRYTNMKKAIGKHSDVTDAISSTRESETEAKALLRSRISNRNEL